MSKYLELVESSFTQEHLDKQQNQNPYVAYSIQDGKVIYTIIPKETLINYFYIESLEDNNIITLDSTTWAGYGDNKSKLEYSNDTTSWTSMNGVDSITIDNGERLYMRCIEGNICKDINSIPEEESEIVIYTPLFKTSANCNIGGNLNSVMFDYTYKTEDCVLSAFAFACLFVGLDMMTEESANYIIDASKLELPATTLVDYCYYNMFAYCTSLVTAPKLPATELAEGCYTGMFEGCSSLTTAPELSATKLADGCYSSMFCDCTSLTTAPELLATTLAEGCYSGMFDDCTSLVTTPKLPATKLADGCYSSMFSGCTSLTTAPELLATTLAEGCYSDMFSGCTSLTTVPELPATILTGECYYNMFQNCTSLVTAPKLPATTLAEYCYCQMFNGCTALTTAPELPVTTLALGCYHSMFGGCKSLTTAPELPATTLANGCYHYMFSGCKSLTTAPELPAPELTESCYRCMFTGCTKLNHIKCLATDISAISCTYLWVEGVSSTGTFIKHPNMSDWHTSLDGIPSGWDVEDAEI